MEGNPFPFNNMDELQDSLNQVYCQFRVGSAGGREGGVAYICIYICIYIRIFHCFHWH